MIKFMHGVLLALAVTVSGYASAVTIDPSTGLSGGFSFGGTGDIGTYQTSPVEGWEVTAATTSTIDISVFDCCVIGDEFALYVNDVLVPWDTTTASGLFEGHVTGLVLAAGTHTFDFMLTAACCSGGGGSYSFSALSPVPVPAAAWLFGTALLSFVGFSRRKKLAK
ncbi:MAG: VPLPA-CTERM sorting domain-containing protein [Neptuniibacter sp.]